MFGLPLARHRPEEQQADAIGAVRCAREMRRALQELNEEYRRLRLPEMRIGIGVRSGILVGCSLGSSQRQQYATIGDVTNTASRLMAEAKRRLKEAGDGDMCMVVVSGATAALVGEACDLGLIGIL